MGAITKAEWKRALAIVEQGIEQHIQEAAERAAGYRSMLYQLKRVDPPQLESARKRPAAGTLPARVLDIVGESEDDEVTFRQILDGKPGAPEGTVKRAVQDLVRDGHLIAMGHTTQRRYSLPTKKGGR